MILGNGFCQHIFGDSGGGGLFVPAAAFQPVADKLFVKRRGIAADLVALRRPEAAGIGGEHFVHQGERAVGIQPEFKFEFGLDANGTLTLMDEVLTPDSSRFWAAQSYQVGSNPPSFDKQFIRDWLERSGWNKQPPAPAIPEDVLAKTVAKYQEALRLLTA